MKLVWLTLAIWSGTSIAADAQSNTPLTARLYDLCATASEDRFSGCVKGAQALQKQLTQHNWTGIAVMEDMAEWCLRDASVATLEGGGPVQVPAFAETCIGGAMVVLKKLRDRGVSIPLQ